jgi:DNA-binding MarR family transcriptional regulator
MVGEAVDDEVEQVLAHYPRIYFACHSRHVKDPRNAAKVSAHQASILDHLDSVEPSSLQDLAGHMGVTPATMSLAIERLVRQGYVLRRRSKADGRQLELRLSAAGVRLREAQSVLDPARVRALLDNLSDSERADALRGLALLAEAPKRRKPARRQQ